MAKYATGKYAKAISDRSGMEFPYREMVREWNGAFVHVSEFEPKQPQLEPKPMNGDSISLRNVRPGRVEPSVAAMLGNNPFSTTNHLKQLRLLKIIMEDQVVIQLDLEMFKEVQEGCLFLAYENSSGFSITVTTTNKYTFSLGTTASITEEGGGPTVSAGPVTLDSMIKKK